MITTLAIYVAKWQFFENTCIAKIASGLIANGKPDIILSRPVRIPVTTFITA